MHFLQEHGKGKGGSPETQVERYFSLMTLSLPKLQCYTKFLFHGTTGKTRNKIDNFEQFHRQKRPKLVKNLN